MPAKGERAKATDFSIAAIMAPRGPSFGHYHLQGIGNAATAATATAAASAPADTNLDCTSAKGFSSSASVLDLHRARTSPLNIVATATVVTEEASLAEEEGAGISCEIESEGTEEKSAHDEEEEEIDVDVEECSSIDEDRPSNDSTDDLRIFTTSSSTSSSTRRNRHHNRKYDGNNDSVDNRKHRRRTLCNSEELRDVECQLETKELWDKFNDLGTEMIITKTGRNGIEMICTGGRTCQGRPLVCKGPCNPRSKHHTRKIKWTAEGRPIIPSPDFELKSDKILDNVREAEKSTIPSTDTLNPIINSTQVPLSMGPLSRIEDRGPCRRVTRHSITNIYFMSFIVYLTINTFLALFAWNEPTYHVFLCTQIMGIIFLANWLITGTLPIDL